MPSLAYVLGAVCLTACIGDLDVDEFTWACSANRDCGAGRRCFDGTCVASDSEVGDGDAAEASDAFDGVDQDASGGADSDTAAPGTRCEAGRAATGVAGGVSFAAGDDAGRATLTVTIDGVSGTFDLPAGVGLVATDGGPLVGCCENACCLPPD